LRGEVEEVEEVKEVKEKRACWERLAEDDNDLDD
jgi:uncharacterized protein YdcH (DUF465 family)